MLQITKVVVTVSPLPSLNCALFSHRIANACYFSSSSSCGHATPASTGNKLNIGQTEQWEEWNESQERIIYDFRLPNLHFTGGGCDKHPVVVVVGMKTRGVLWGAMREK